MTDKQMHKQTQAQKSVVYVNPTNYLFRNAA